MADPKARKSKKLDREGWRERFAGAMGETAGDVAMGIFTPMLKSDALRSLASKYGGYLRALVRLITSFLPEVQGETIEGVIERAINDLQREGVDPNDEPKMKEAAKAAWEKIKGAAGTKKPEALATNSNPAEAFADLDEEYELPQIEASLLALGADLDTVLAAFKMTTVTAKALRGVGRIQNEGLRQKLLLTLKPPPEKPKKTPMEALAALFGFGPPSPAPTPTGLPIADRARLLQSQVTYRGRRTLWGKLTGKY